MDNEIISKPIMNLFKNQYNTMKMHEIERILSHKYRNLETGKIVPLQPFFRTNTEMPFTYWIAQGASLSIGITDSISSKRVNTSSVNAIKEKLCPFEAIDLSLIYQAYSLVHQTSTSTTNHKDTNKLYTTLTAVEILELQEIMEEIKIEDVHDESKTSLKCSTISPAPVFIWQRNGVDITSRDDNGKMEYQGYNTPLLTIRSQMSSSSRSNRRANGLGRQDINNSTKKSGGSKDQLSSLNTVLSQEKKLVSPIIVPDIFSCVLRFAKKSKHELGKEHLPSHVNSSIKSHFDLLVTQAVVSVASFPILATKSISKLFELIEHSPLELRVDAVSTPPPTFQWFQNGNKLIGENQNVLSIKSLKMHQEGTYTCEVANVAGTVVFEDYSVIVKKSSPAPPNIKQQTNVKEKRATPTHSKSRKRV
jgi:hypothetical protein